MGIDIYAASFGWDLLDTLDWLWYPQGITGTADANMDNTYADTGQKVLLVSWHYDEDETLGVEACDNAAEDRGARVSFVLSNSIDTSIPYDHILLVEPTIIDYGGEFRPSFKAVNTHAGGIVWYNDDLYVADTHNGFRVFAMDKIMYVSEANTCLIGWDGEKYHAFGYKYILPQVDTYEFTECSCGAKFSFVSLDRYSPGPPALVTGGWSKSENEKLYRWLFDAESGRLANPYGGNLPGGVVVPEGLVVPEKVYCACVTDMQGAFSYQDVYWLSCGDVRRLYMTKTANCKWWAWAHGPEDLHYSPGSDNLWCLTEFIPDRYVFAVKLDDFNDW